jgi:hypothetical protein
MMHSTSRKWFIVALVVWVLAVALSITRTTYGLQRLIDGEYNSRGG